MPPLVDPVLARGALCDRAQPTLTVDELVLRPFEADDVPAVVAAYADPAVQRWHGQSMTSAEATDWVASCATRWSAETGAGWAVADRDGLVGRVGLNHVGLWSGQASIAYWVLPRARGRGVAPRALRELTRWAFADLGLHRLDLEHSTRNAASCRVAVKAGYPLEGTRRAQGRHADGWHDMHAHARVATDAA